jgi:hypothetical protein
VDSWGRLALYVGYRQLHVEHGVELYVDHRRLHIVLSINGFMGLLALYVGYRQLHVEHGVELYVDHCQLHVILSIIGFLGPLALYVGYRQLHVVAKSCTANTSSPPYRTLAISILPVTEGSNFKVRRIHRFCRHSEA